MSFSDTKNLTPRVLSLFTALVIASANTLLALIIGVHWHMLLAVFLCTALITYLVYFYTLQQFIYRKIKLIYKFIYQTKATKREEYFYDHILPQKTIEEVTADVHQWATQRRDEIEKLQRNEDFRKEFLMNLAHELRTPIFTVQGYVDTLIGGALEDPAVNRKFLTATAKSVDRLAQLVDDLDEISKLESGQSEIAPEQFPIQDLIRDVYDEFALTANEKLIHLDLKKGTERTLNVHADRPKIRQVLVNIIENALKYGRAGGHVTTGCYAMDEGRIYVEISDDGYGIAEEHLPRIFERFYRADRSRSRTIGGTGLGLAIVKHIIEAHGQTVNARSTPGVGSSFGFTLEK